MTRFVFSSALGFGILCLCATHAFAQSPRNCGPRDKVVGMLSSKYKETRRSIGLGAGNRVMEVYASEEGSWTVVVTMTNGLTCLIASGQSFESVEPGEPVPEGTAL